MCGGVKWNNCGPVEVLKLTPIFGMFNLCLNCGSLPGCGDQDRKYRRKWIKRARRVIKKMKAKGQKDLTIIKMGSYRYT
jgi:hypothetical protein